MKNERTIEIALKCKSTTLTQLAMKTCFEILKNEIMALNGGCPSKDIDKIMDGIKHFSCLSITNAQELCPGIIGEAEK